MRSSSNVQPEQGFSLNGPHSEVRSVSRPQISTGPLACVPCLRLFADEITVLSTDDFEETFESTVAPLAAISYEYDGIRVRGDAFGPGAKVQRDERAETAARRLLESFGAVDLDCLETHAVSPSVTADYIIRCEGSIHDFCAFGAYVVPQLVSMGWRVEIDEDYPFRVVEEQAPWYCDVAPEKDKPDWFSMELGVEIDGQRVNLLPALVDLLERTAEKDSLTALLRRSSRCLALPVGDRLYAAVPTERVRAILRIVSELYEGRFGVPERLRVPPVKLPAIARLDEVFTAGGAELNITGAGSVRVRAISEPTCAVDPPSCLKADLRPYQKLGLQYLQSLRSSNVGGILADDMGLGKTLQTIAHIATEKEQGRLGRPVLIVAPTSLVFNWEREIEKFAPSLRVLLLHGARRHEAFDRIGQHDVVVTSYPLVHRDEERLAQEEFHMLILDEAQLIKNESSRAHRSVRALRAAHRLCLTGTPVENHLGELWALMDFLNPGLLGDEMHFSRFFRVPIEKHKNKERLSALRDMLAPYVLRRMKTEVAKDLPPKTELFRPVELPGTQRELYESIRVAAHAEVRKIIKKKGLAASTIPILTALTKLRQVCCDPRLSAIGAASGVRESAKYDLFFDMLGKQLADGHRVLVFSQFTSMLALLAAGLRERGIVYAELTGATADRRAAVDEFEGGKASVFLISLKAGGTGLTLTSADTVIHYDPWWNPAVQAQATDRAYRIGQKKPVFVYNLFAAGSVEERILKLQRKKRDVASALLGDAQALEAFSEDELDVLFAPLSA